MSSRYNIGGSATINGVIMINSTTGKIAKAVRGSDGVISVMEPKISTKLMEFYRTKIEKAVKKIPALREIIKLLLVLFLTVSSLFTGILESFFHKNGWSLKKIISALFFLIGIYVFLFANDYYSLAFLGIVILHFNKKIALILRYHGAEHKCINMYEGMNEGFHECINENVYDGTHVINNLSVENAKPFSRIHFRCGTNIIVLLIPLSLFYYFFAEQYLLSMFAGDYLDFAANLVLIGISVELFRLFQKPIMRWMLKPGILLQRFITTKEPDDSEIEVALCALKAVI
jgi:uncharacterized protein YqhQ